MTGLFYLQSSQISLLFRRDPVTFAGFLNGLVVSPVIQPFRLYIGQRFFILLCKSCGKIPGDHHIHIVLLRADTCSKLQVLFPEIFIQKMLHQHPDSIADRIGFIR